MKRLIFVLTVLVMLFLPGLSPTLVCASAQDEQLISDVGDEVGSLWDYVDESSGVSDETFYPEFIVRSQAARANIERIYDKLGQTDETGKTKDAIDSIREDLQLILITLVAWEDAASANDTEAFEDASYLLSSVIEEYNDHIDDYNHAEYSAKAVAEIALYFGSYLLSLTLASALLVWAILHNKHSDNLVQEILRKLRWHAVLASLPVWLVMTLPPIMYIFSDKRLPIWAWCLMLLSFGPLIFVLVRYCKVRRLLRG